MTPFSCQNCGQLLFFPNVQCGRCGYRLGYLPDENTFLALTSDADGWRSVTSTEVRFRFCANAEHEACNWLVPAGSADRFCRACRHNGTVPDLSQPQNVLHWRKLEIAKHHLFYSLLKLRLPLTTRSEDPQNGLVFEFLADSAVDGGDKVMTGHDNGQIVIALAEADDAEREKRRNAMGEPYRTLLGHFRHEIGHYYWDRLVRDAGRLQACRAIFGDDTEDYGQALKRHYESGPPDNWQDEYISQYAATHAWEDFAETWAHYLHIIDTLEMAAEYRVQVHDLGRRGADAAVPMEGAPYGSDAAMQDLIACWLPLTVALNSINRCMGLADLYPFVLSPAVVRKLGFVHDLVHGRVRAD